MRRLESVIAVLVLCAGAHAERYRFRYYGADEGLVAATSTVIQDRTGFVWVASSNGLFRYDGVRFQRFGTEDGLPSASIRSIHQTVDGTLWVSTAHALARLRGNSFEMVGAELAHLGGEAYGLASNGDGTLYIATQHGLFCLAAPYGKSPPVQRVPDVPPDFGESVYVDPDDVVWFDCGSELCTLDHGRMRRYGEADGLPPQRWSAMIRDAQGTVWVRGPQRMFVLQPGAQRFVARDSGLPQCSNASSNMVLDTFGRLLATTDSGVARWTGERWELIGMAQGLESEAITWLMRDREGSIWISSWGGGVARWQGNGEWTNWTVADGLPNNLVWAIRGDRSGDLWLGTDRGLARMRGNKPVDVLTTGNGLAGDKVKTLEIGPDGAVWAGSLPGGITRIDPDGGQIWTFGAAEGLSDTRVVSIHIDEEKRLWVATGQGLFRSDNLSRRLRFERQTPPGSTDRTMFLRLRGGQPGVIWAASTQGLFRWERGTWRQFNSASGLRSDAISHVSAGAGGSIWAAYRDPIGLSQLVEGLTGTSVQHFDRINALPSSHVLFIGNDFYGRLWVGTDGGLARRDGDAWTVITHEDGLVWDDCAANAFFAEPDGGVWVGTLRGLSHYQPLRTAAWPGPPPAAILSAAFGSVRAGAEALVKVPYTRRDFAVTFGALSFVNERSMRFRYRLSGLSQEWVETRVHEARYPNLAPGSYRFEVSARNINGGWGPPAVLVFTVVPPWWRTLWFELLAGGCLLGLICAGVRLRMDAMLRDRRRLERAVRERTAELQCQKNLIELQKREIEDLLRKTETVSRLKSEFLANMSHEIRTPMNGVIGMTQLALSTGLDSEQREYVETIRDSADSLLVVINDILDFSKIEAGKMELANDPFSLRKCLADAVQVFLWKAEEKGLALSYECDARAPDVLLGDGGRLRQVLLNLLGNAIKFTEKGSVQLRVVREQTASAGHQRLCFAVRDTGPGIAREKQGLIFESFAQVDGSARRRQGGTGLGLAICAKLVSLMRGRIWVESAPGEGSTFHFLAAFGAAPAGVEPKDSPHHMNMPAAPPMHILLAEDNLVNRKLAERTLTKWGHSVRSVENGRAAVAAAAAEEFDIVLMDVQMPEMDGFEATAQIRSMEPPGRRVPIVALTAHAMSRDRDECLRAGMDDYLSKPIQIQALAEILNRMSVAQYTEVS